VLVVVASRHDQAAREIVAAWAPREAALLTCEDLSTSGWRHRLFDPSNSRAVVSGQIIREDNIRGVLIRRPWIFEQELVHIARSDREYVAAEMNAFLLSWLSHLSCHVLNRPTGTCLSGPNWRPLQWAQAAARAGMLVESMHWRIPALHGKKPGVSEVRVRESVDVTVAGERCLGAPTEACCITAKRLAAIAGTALLTIQLTAGKQSPHFLGANPMPSLKDAEIAKAVCDYLVST
jgi:hypothetical protein